MDSSIETLGAQNARTRCTTLSARSLPSTISCAFLLGKVAHWARLLSEAFTAATARGT